MNTDPHITHDSLLHGEIVQLRVWGTDHIYLLPPRALRCTLGSDVDCRVRLPDRDVLPMHAHLSRERRQWFIRALGDTPGLFRDGMRCDAFSLEAGVEIGVGGVALIAETAPWIALRNFCSRMLGWGRDHLPIVDHALRAIRACMTCRAPLHLYGESDLVPLAHDLHRRTFGSEQPFVVCDPRRHDVDESVRCPANYQIGMAALQAAAGGSLCMRGERLPRDFSSVLARLREPSLRVQLIICTSQSDKHPYLVTAMRFLATAIRVPSLRKRTKELPRIIDEYTLDAIATLRALIPKLPAGDQTWLLKHATSSLPEIEKATLRLVALRTSANLPRAADRLGMAPVSLARWMKRRKLRVVWE